MQEPDLDRQTGESVSCAPLHWPDRYGYRTNLRHPRVYRWYLAYKRKLGLPEWCPLSDAQRIEFDERICQIIGADIPLHQLHQARKENPPEAADTSGEKT